MTQRDNILQELKELQSRLADSTPENIYTLPEGYFDGLADQVMRRIKALETTNAVDELTFLSPVLSQLSKKMPYTIPAGYFEEMETSLISSVSTSSQSAKEELENLSSLLSGMKKEIPYSVPQGYFDTLVDNRNIETARPETKVFSLGSRKWIRFAAAAVVTGIIVTTGYFFLTRDKVSVDSDSYKWVKVNTKKVSTEKIDEFIQLTQEEKSGQGTIAAVEKNLDIKELVKDIPEKEIQNLLNDTELLDDAETNIASDETLMN